MPKLSKERAREFIQERARNPKPLPSQKEMRRQLGIDLVEADREARDKTKRRE